MCTLRHLLKKLGPTTELVTFTATEFTRRHDPLCTAVVVIVVSLKCSNPLPILLGTLAVLVLRMLSLQTLNVGSFPRVREVSIEVKQIVFGSLALPKF